MSPIKPPDPGNDPIALIEFGRAKFDALHEADRDMFRRTLLASMALVEGCRSAGPVSPVASGARVRFEIHIPDQSVNRVVDPRQNGGRPVQMTLTNESNQSLWIDGRAAIGPARMA